ncbi:histone-lysine N-methyltransferase EHMT2-like [Limulus polyphemus]|uniref:Histone-lysine N-methyltransferase EHMT2-like n=1 Tax=Limulus polyphemus TaxID=6850 RepID=A0ABM1S0J7_LIMPO|nr:histone-lysine N-methyltransferase EHMT2-like [Limulus polyphemus]XP_022237151.1 histone-lysine N-methyltransferase EHMT2-like [Limulus polyphemus]XP_022237152.1 histone-lysine N-methyltransferase EHMT2-like [Limulus polyphemus]XP_022237153.1 histone-lysine N-methyltransferase EHMT2-like [Limulus polyphemus]XP_022237154.1 histone-lysine N-methyltransferase EHMT2-like [Limulus polyphemus]
MNPSVEKKASPGLSKEKSYFDDFPKTSKKSLGRLYGSITKEKHLVDKTCSQTGGTPMKDSIRNVKKTTTELQKEHIKASIEKEDSSTSNSFTVQNKPKTPIFTNQKQEGRAKMSAPSKGDHIQNQALLKLAVSPAGMIRQTSHETRPISASLPVSNMTGLKNILNSFMKTSISQVLRSKIDSQSETKSESSDNSLTQVSELLEKSDLKGKIGITENMNEDEEKDTNVMEHPCKDIEQDAASDNTSEDHLKENKKIADTSRIESLCTQVNSQPTKSQNIGTVSSTPKSPVLPQSSTVPVIPGVLQNTVLTRQQVAFKVMMGKKKKKSKHFRGATYDLYLSKRKKKNKDRPGELSQQKDDISSIAGTETSSCIDSEEEDSETSEGFRTSSEVSLQDDESDYGHISSGRQSTETHNCDESLPLTSEIKKQKPVGLNVIDSQQQKNSESRPKDCKMFEDEVSNNDKSEVLDEPSNLISSNCLHVERAEEMEVVKENSISTNADTKEDAALLPTEEPAVPEPSQPSDLAVDKNFKKAEEPPVVEETSSKDNLMEDDGIIEADSYVSLDTKSTMSSIASSVKSRQRVKRHLLNDHNEVDSLGLSSSVSIGSDGIGQKKAKKAFHGPCGPTVVLSSPVEEGNPGLLPHIEIVVDSKLPLMSRCTCQGAPLDPKATQITEAKIFCQAIDSISGRLVGCCNSVTCHQLVRPSVKIPFTTMCEVHLWRLAQHHCCPSCGVFCTQGDFLQCITTNKGKKQIHLFHKKCKTIQGNSEVPQCPHCGRASLKSIRLELNTPTPPIFYLSQKPLFTVPKAKMAFSRQLEIKRKGEEEEEAISSRSFMVPETGKILSSAGLPLGPDRAQLEALLIALASDKLQNVRYTIKSFYAPAKTGNIDKILQLIALGFDPNYKFEEHENETPLHAASSAGHLVVVHLLVQAGAVLDHLTNKLYTPLMYAVECNQVPVVEYLIKAGTQLDARGEDGMTALHLAARCGSVEICEMLLDTGRINVNIQDDGGWTPVIWATEHSKPVVVRLLVDQGADPNLKDNEENTALHWSAFSGCLEVSQLFLDIGCDLGALNEHGDTPLHIASRRDNYDSVVLFLARGADIEALNKGNELPIECCLNKNSPTWMVLKMNQELKRVTASKLHQADRILERDITRGKERNPIQCVNGLDTEGELEDFLYIVENCETSPINIDRTITSLQSCRCTDDCTSPSCTCATISFKCWYNREGHILPEFNMLDPPMIFECNRACLCWKNCNNRVMQNGITCRLQVFRTKGKGWGVRTLKEIHRGSFVCEYIGEIISDSEADQREDDSYLFDLDNRDGETFCLDARYYGNISRFINHLCEPNLVPVKVFVDHQDLSFPRIAFFSSRDIKPHEELGFDYGEKFWVIKYKNFTCGCGSPKCRYSKETIHTTLENYYRRLKEEQGDEIVRSLPQQ